MAECPPLLPLKLDEARNYCLIHVKKLRALRAHVPAGLPEG
jgi:hypothetical protein